MPVNDPDKVVEQFSKSLGKHLFKELSDLQRLSSNITIANANNISGLKSRNLGNVYGEGNYKFISDISRNINKFGDINRLLSNPNKLVGTDINKFVSTLSTKVLNLRQNQQPFAQQFLVSQFSQLNDALNQMQKFAIAGMKQPDIQFKQSQNVEQLFGRLAEQEKVYLSLREAEKNALRSEITARREMLSHWRDVSLVSRTVQGDPTLRYTRSSMGVPMARVMPFTEASQKTQFKFQERYNQGLNRATSIISKLSNAAQNIGFERILQVSGQTTGAIQLSKRLTAQDIEQGMVGPTKEAIQQKMAGLSGNFEKSLGDMLETEFGKYIGANRARTQLQVTPTVQFEESGAVTGAFTTELTLLSDKLEAAGYDTKKLTEFVDRFSKRAEQLTGTGFAATTTGGRQPTQAMRGGMLTGAANWAKDLSWRSASISMSSMGVYFSLMGIFMALQGAITSLTTSLSDLNTIFKNVGYVDAFGRSAIKANDILKIFGITQKDLVKGWENVTYAQSAFGLAMSGLGASIFKNEKFVNNLVRSVATLFEKLAEKSVMDSFIKFVDAGAKALPNVVDALKSVADVLGWVGDHPGLIKLATQMYAITMLVQPLTSGISLFLGAFGQTAEAIKMITMLNKSVAALNVTLFTTSIYMLEVAAAIELIARAYQMVSGQEAPWWAKPITAGVNVLSGGDITSGKMFGFAAGGEVTGAQTAEVDDKVVRVEEGEYVINKKSAKKLGKKTLDELNRYANGGATGALPMGNITSRAFENYAKDNQYLSRLNNDLVDKNLQVNASVDSTLNDSASGTRALHVFVDNMRGTGGAQTNLELPLDMSLEGLFKNLQLRIKGPEFKWPKIDFKWPKIEFKWPKIDFKWPKFDFKFPKFDFKWPKIDFKWPKIEIPKLEFKVPSELDKYVKLNEKYVMGTKVEPKVEETKVPTPESEYKIYTTGNEGYNYVYTNDNVGGKPTTPITAEVKQPSLFGKISTEIGKLWKGEFPEQTFKMSDMFDFDFIDKMSTLAGGLRSFTSGEGNIISDTALQGINELVENAVLEGIGTKLEAYTIKNIGKGGAAGATAIGTGSVLELYKTIGQFAKPLQAVVGLAETQQFGKEFYKEKQPATETLSNVNFLTNMFTGGFYKALMASGVVAESKTTGKTEEQIRQEGLTFVSDFQAPITDFSKAVDIYATIQKTMQGPGAQTGMSYLGFNLPTNKEDMENLILGGLSATKIPTAAYQYATTNTPEQIMQDISGQFSGFLKDIQPLNEFAISINPVIAGMKLMGDTFNLVPDKITATGSIIDDSGNILKTSFTNTGKIIDDNGNNIGLRFDEFGKVINDKNEVVGLAFDQTGELLTGKKDELGTSIDGLTTTINDKKDPLASAFDSITGALQNLPFIGDLFGGGTTAPMGNVEDTLNTVNESLSTGLEDVNATLTEDVAIPTAENSTKLDDIKNLLQALIDTIKNNTQQPNVNVTVQGDANKSTVSALETWARDMQYRNVKSAIR